MQMTTWLVYISLELELEWSIKFGELQLGGNILVHTNCMDITMAWKTSCKDVAKHVDSFALHIIFAWYLGEGATAPLPPQMTPLVCIIAAYSCC